MLALITPLVTHGVIDNTARDRIVLELHLSSGAPPLHLGMSGNCLQDIAGCRVEFENRLARTPSSEQEPEVVQLLRQHEGLFLAGDITLSRRECTGSAVHNLLSIEFFVESRVRVLLQVAKFRFTIARGSWRLSHEEEAVQRLLNREVMHEHVLYSVRHYRGAAVAHTGPDFPLCAWDVRLNRAEAYMSIIPTLREKYRCEPGGHLSEAYLVDRTDLLTAAAEEEDAYGHRPTRRREHAWEMLDFVEPEYVDQVSQAMHHPLFREASRMTSAVQEHIISPCGKSVDREMAQVFIPLYSSLVSHLLSTLLLTMEEECPLELAARRMENLRQRLANLGEGIETLPDAHRAPLQRALSNLSSCLSSFCSSLH